MKRVYKYFLGILLFIISVYISLSLLKQRDIPSKIVKKARKELHKSERLRADIYASDLFYDAKSYYDSTMLYWQIENKKNIIARNYDNVKKYAYKTEIIAIEAQKLAKTYSLTLINKLNDQVDTLQKEISKFQKTFDILPLNNKIKRENSQGRILLKEAMLSIQEGELIKADIKFKESVFLIRTSYNDARKYLESYFENLDKWEKQAKTTISNSKKNRTTALLVDKFSRKCYLVNRGNIIDTFDIELGVNWVGDKHYKGDKATPEGLYFIKDMKENHDTKYYKAILIDYPNKEDLAQFKLEKKHKKIPDSASIGNLIEIHGGGGKGVDWTDGCIALRNNEMDILFKYCRKGTMVSIVGSLLPLDEILN